ncbi:MAG TPA: T9SS type A sorting domain-containing protein, partial [Hymenobacter sp.]
AAGDIYSSIVSYATGMGTPAVGTDTYLGSAGNKSGLVVTSAGNLPGTKFAYFSTTSLAANTSAVNSGMEIEIPLSALGGTAVAAGSRLDLFAAFTDSNGNFVSTETIPEVVGRTTAFGTDPDFTTIPGNQSAAYVLGTGVLASRNAVANGLDFQVYPNPATATAKVAYTVPAGRQSVSLAVYNGLGQRVRSLASAEQAGTQEFALGSLPAGAYLVKLQVGKQLTSRKVVVQ